MKLVDKKQFCVIPFGRKKRIDITGFHGQIYVHINDIIKGKCVSFSKEEFEELISMNKRLARKIKSFDSEIQRKKKILEKLEDSSSDSSSTSIEPPKPPKRKRTNSTCRGLSKKRRDSLSDSSSTSIEPLRKSNGIRNELRKKTRKVIPTSDTSDYGSD